MNYNEEKGNLFTLANEYVLGHCISYDCEMGKGIARQFRDRYPNMQGELKRILKTNKLEYPVTILYTDDVTGDKIFNLITKEKFFNKPTKSTIRECIRQMAKICKENEVKKLALPLIGCGLDRLEWNFVKTLILNEFKELDIDIQVRYIDKIN